MPSQDLFASRPFYAGALTGLRTFGVSPDGLLTGVFFEQPWMSSVVEARCSYDRAARSRVGAAASIFDFSSLTRACGGNPEQHEVGTLGCTCGFYAYFDGRNDYLRHGSTLHYGAAERVAGVIEGFGVATVGSRGFRAAKARIVALVLPEGTYNRALILAIYPDVAAYLTTEEALADHPLTVPELIEERAS